MQYGFGVDLGGTTVKLGFFDRDGSLLDKWEIPTNKESNGAAILPEIAQSISGYLQEKKISREAVLGIGMGVPGSVNGNGVVNKCVNLGWGVFNVEEELSRLTGFPVKAGNDANMAALGEAWKGSGCDNMLLVTFGTGVGGGIVLDGRSVFGVHGAAGEIGHITIDPHETRRCVCGKRGCAEQYCSATGIVRLAKERLESTGMGSALRQQEITAKAVFDAAKAGDPVALMVLEQVFDYMGQLLAAVCGTLDPERVVLGGGVSKAGDVLLTGAKRYFDKYVFHANAGVTFHLAQLGNDAGIYGAFKLALDKL